MKVIGKLNNKYMVEASENEIANLFGFYWADRDDFRKLTGMQRGQDLIGLEIKPDVAYQRLSWLKKRSDEFDRLCKNLRNTADMIEQHESLFDMVVADK